MWIGLWIWSFLTFPIMMYVHVHSTEPFELQPGLNLALATGFVHAVYFIVLSFGILSFPLALLGRIFDL